MFLFFFIMIFFSCILYKYARESIVVLNNFFLKHFIQNLLNTRHDHMCSIFC